MKLNGSRCKMELDTGAAVLTISETRFKELCPKVRLKPTKIKLRTYSGEILRPVGAAKVAIQYGNQQSQETIYVFPLNVDTIFGRNWL